MNATTDNSIMTVQEVSDYLRVHPSTIYRMLKRNQLPAFRVGFDWRFVKSKIDEFMEKTVLNNTTNPAQ